jgi:signal transduction histidine kinase
MPSQHNLEIHYTGLSFIKPEQMQFRYRLEGLDEDWTNAGTRREAFYPYLPPGKYTFRVIAANSDSVWNEQGAWIEIVVQPPFYRTAWFIALTILSLTVIGFALYRQRVSELKRKQSAQEEFSRRLINAHEAERSRVAAELHDSIGQTLAMIKNRAVFGAQMIDNPEAKEQLEAITSQTTQAISEVREISYNLRPYLLENLGLTRAIKSLVGKIEEFHLLKIESRIDDVDDLFAPEAEMSVYRIVQESLNNVAKHSDADEAALTIEKTDGIITIKIEDDGCGFDKNAPPKTDAGSGGFGLLGINERVRMLGGSLDIQTGKGKGTKLMIKIVAKK